MDVKKVLEEVKARTEEGLKKLEEKKKRLEVRVEDMSKEEVEAELEWLRKKII